MIQNRKSARASIATRAAVCAIGGLLVGGLALAQDNSPGPHDMAEIKMASTPSVEDLNNPDWVQAGRTRFIQTCAYCHGTEGEAGKTRSFKTRTGWDPQVIHDTIFNGRVDGPNVMPSWKGSIPDNVIWQIVAYIKSLSGGAKQVVEDTAGAEQAAEIKMAPTPSIDELKDPKWIQAGRTHFVQTCAYCHGTEGEAGKTRSFKTRKAWDPQVIHDTIFNGRVDGPNVMPSWKGSIPDNVIWQLVAYIKSLSANYTGD